MKNHVYVHKKLDIANCFTVQSLAFPRLNLMLRVRMSGVIINTHSFKRVWLGD